MREPSRIGSYLIEREIGRGGMGVVYLARDTRLERQVAVKALPVRLAGDADRLRRFRREALLLASLNHPNIAQIYQLEEQDGARYLILEYVPGENLSTRIRRGPLPVSEALELCSQIARAIEAAHDRDVIHRDLKPANVRVTPDGHIKVLDFGIAKARAASAVSENDVTIAPDETGAPSGTAFTRGARTMGTPGYMSPEQARSRDVDRRTDVWAFGCILFECLAGTHAFEGDTYPELLSAVLVDQPDWSRLPEDTPPAIRQLLLACLAKDPADRLSDIADARRAIDDCAGIPSTLTGRRRGGSIDTPNNLPRQRTPLIGRRREVARIEEALADCALLTLTGPGGSGKTRLALELAARRLGDYRDGVWFAGLAPLSDPDLVAPTLAVAAGFREEPGRGVIETIVAGLKEKAALIVLDNCEHLLGACSRLAARLLADCPNVAVLATSREPLGVPGESVRPVPTLPFPADDPRPSAHDVGRSAAVRLFVDRARAVAPDFALTDDNAPAVAAICRRLDGIPLAIELAAARVRLLSPVQILAKLDDRFRLLKAAGREASADEARHHTLRGAIDWSYALLSKDERALARTLSVFAGGWTLESATSVCAGEAGDMDEFDVLELLGNLVDKSLLVVDTGDAPERRYRYLTTLRQYVREKLEEAGEGEAARERHVDYFLSLAERADEPLRGGKDQKLWIERLEAERQNLLAALAACSTIPGGTGKGLRLAGPLGRFWELHGHFGIGRRAVTEALERPGADEPTVARAKALNGLAASLLRLGEYSVARSRADEALSLARRLGEKDLAAAALTCLGILTVEQGEPEAAKPFYEEALALKRQTGDRWGVAIALNNLGFVEEQKNDLDRARALHEESLEIRKSLEDAHGVSTSLSNLANVARQRGDTAVAVRLAEESLEIRREIGDRFGTAWSLVLLAGLARDTGETRAARRRYREALLIRRDLEDRRGIAECMECVAALASGVGEHALPARLAVAAEAIRERIGAPLPEAERNTLEAALERSRAALGGPEFRRVRDDARGRDPGHAVDEALAWLEQEERTC